jgi:hypothetical protein
MNSKNQTVEYKVYFNELEERLQQLQQMKCEGIEINNRLLHLCETTAGDGTRCPCALYPGLMLAIVAEQKEACLVELVKSDLTNQIVQSRLEEALREETWRVEEAIRMW